MPVSVVRKARSFANIDPPTQARVALMRFGLGPKPGVTARLAATDGAALQACLNEIYNPKALLIPDDQVKVYCSDTNADVILDYANCCRFGAVFKPISATGFLPQPSQIIHAERAARYAKALEPEVGFAERLVHFWSNHFSVFASKSNMVLATAGHMERNVIRPRVLGKFADLLKAVYRHPAMICYLENQASIGPGSPYSKARASKNYSYNENLAREIFELHTLGIDGGHTQEDVIAFAKILTGWTHIPGWKKWNVEAYDGAGQFDFRQEFHEPGEQRVLGVTYSQTGIDQGLAVLDALAAHPATAQHIAYKMIRHFVMDEPSPDLVAYLAQIFRSSGGDLQVMSKALVSLPQFWNHPMERIVQPMPWQMSVLRGMGVTRQKLLARSTLEKQQTGEDYPTIIGVHWLMSFFGQNFWGSLTPDGFPDENYFWMNGNAVRTRKDFAAGTINPGLVDGKSPRPPLEIADDLLSGFQSAATRAEIAEQIAKKVNDKYPLVTLFASPEYILR